MPHPAPVEERCLCGNLLARITPAGVEILCRRCKRKHLIPWRGEQREEQNVDEDQTQE